MKRLIQLSAVALVGVILLAGCADKAGSVENSATTSTVETGLREVDQNAGDRYRMYTPSPIVPDDFDKMVSENVIDRDYAVDLDKAATTQEFVEIQQQYIEKWKSEWQETILKLGEILNETDYQNYKNAQDDWEKQMLSSVQVDRDIIGNTQYEIMLGSCFRWMFLSHIREQYRERTFSVQYMLYLVEGKDAE